MDQGVSQVTAQVRSKNSDLLRVLGLGGGYKYPFMNTFSPLLSLTQELEAFYITKNKDWKSQTGNIVSAGREVQTGFYIHHGPPWQFGYPLLSSRTALHISVKLRRSTMSHKDICQSAYFSVVDLCGCNRVMGKSTRLLRPLWWLTLCLILTVHLSVCLCVLPLWS